MTANVSLPSEMNWQCGKSRLLQLLLNNDFVISLLWNWLDFRCLGVMDMAMTNTLERSTWLSILGAVEGTVLDDWRHCHLSLRWLIKRRMNPKNIDTCDVTERKSRRIITYETLVGISMNSLESIVLRHGSMTDAIIPLLVRGCPRLVSINLSGKFTSSGISTLACGYPRLKSISLSGSIIASDGDITNLATSCTDLQKVSFEGWSNLTNVGMSSMIRICHQLEAINIKACYRMKYFDLSGLSRLQSLSLHDFEIVEANLLDMINGTPQLRSIDLNYVSDFGLTVIAVRCPELRSISLSHCLDVSDIGISAIAKRCSQLRTVKIIECGFVSDAGIMALASGCPQLQTIELASSGYATDDGLLSLALQCPLLESIQINYCEYITDTGLTALAYGCSNLRILRLFYCLEISDASLLALSLGCSRLQIIELYDCVSVTDVGLSHLAKGCHDLKTMSLKYCRNITDTGLSALAAGCSQLKAVTFKGCCNITHIGLRVLFEGCPQLKSLTTDYSFSAQDREYEWQLKRKYPSSLVLLRTQVEYNTYGDYHDEEHSTFNMLINIITLILRVLMSRILRISFSRT
jgi:BspA type Leucine rich repeat region (6 copies)/Leucine Rich repeat